MNSKTDIYTFFKGRVALHALLKAAGIGSGHQVLMPGYTCVVVPNAVNYTGAQPVYLEIDPVTYNLDLDRLEDGLGRTWHPGQAKAIIAQHSYGIPCDMDALKTFARKYDLFLIEDACHALGSTWRGQPVGTLGDAAFFSSQWSKPITTGLGGWATVNNPDLRATLEDELKNYPAPKNWDGILLEIQYLVHNVVDHPRLFWAVQQLYRTLGKLGLVIGSSSTEELACKLPADYQKRMHPLQIKRLNKLLLANDRLVETRRSRARAVEEALIQAGFPVLSLPAECAPVFLRYPLMVENKSEILALARQTGIQIGDWFLSPIHPNTEHWQLAGYVPGTCPVAEEVSQKVINIPTHHRMTNKEIKRTIDFLQRHAKIGLPHDTNQG